MSQTDHFTLVEQIRNLRPDDWTTQFKHAEFFKEYGYRSTGPCRKWVWYTDRLMAQTNETLHQILELCKV